MFNLKLSSETTKILSALANINQYVCLKKNVPYITLFNDNYTIKAKANITETPPETIAFSLQKFLGMIQLMSKEPEYVNISYDDKQIRFSVPNSETSLKTETMLVPINHFNIKFFEDVDFKCTTENKVFSFNFTNEMLKKIKQASNVLNMGTLLFNFTNSSSPTLVLSDATFTDNKTSDEFTIFLEEVSQNMEELVALNVVNLTKIVSGDYQVSCYYVGTYRKGDPANKFLMHFVPEAATTPKIEYYMSTIFKK